MILKQEIIELVRLNIAEDIGNISFSSPYISIRTGSLLRIKCVSKLAEYVGQFFISIIALIGF